MFSSSSLKTSKSTSVMQLTSEHDSFGQRPYFIPGKSRRDFSVGNSYRLVLLFEFLFFDDVTFINPCRNKLVNQEANSAKVLLGTF